MLVKLLLLLALVWRLAAPQNNTKPLFFWSRAVMRRFVFYEREMQWVFLIFLCVRRGRARARAHLLVLLSTPLVLAYVRVDFVAPALRALLARSAGELGRDKRPAIAVLRLTQTKIAQGGGERSF